MILKQSTAYTRMFLMIDSTDHITGKTGLTVVVTLSKAGGAFGAAGGTVTEVSSGWYKIALTTTDTNTLGDLAYHCAVAGADATDFVDTVSVRINDDMSFPATSGRSMVVDANGLVDANTVKVGPTASGTAQTARDIGASVLLSTGTGTGQLDFTSGVVKANATQWVGGTIPAVNVTGVPLVDLKYTLGTISPATAGSVRADAVTGAVGSVTGAVGSVTGNVGGNVTGSVGSVAAGGINAASLAADTITAAKVASDVTDEIWAKSCTEPTAVVGASPTAIAAISWLLTLSRNTITQTATTQILKADDTTTTIASSTVSDDGTTFTRGEFS